MTERNYIKKKKICPIEKQNNYTNEQKYYSNEWDKL